MSRTCLASYVFESEVYSVYIGIPIHMRDEYVRNVHNERGALMPNFANFNFR